MRLQPIRRADAGSNRRRPRWLSSLVACAGTAATLAALGDLAAAGLALTALVALLGLLAAGALAERYPLPLEATGERGVAMTPVFGLTALVLFGWAAGTIVFAGATAVAFVMDSAARRRLGGAAASAAVSGATAGAAGLAAQHAGAGEALTVCAAAAAYWMARAALPQQTSMRSPSMVGVRARALASALPSAFCASAALVFVVLWQRSPGYSLALAGPLAAIVLYARSTQRAIGAMRLALTDPLTGLGNRRRFQEELRQEQAALRGGARTLSLLIVDIDDFKAVNDRSGHPVGDEVLVAVAARLRGGGEAYRLGGDEFAVLLPGADGDAAVAAAEAIRRRIRNLHAGGERVTGSIGVATVSDADAADVVRFADGALYRAKEDGKDCVAVHPEPSVAGRRAGLLGRSGRRRPAVAPVVRTAEGGEQ